MSVGVAPLLREGCAEADTLEDPLGDGVLLELLVETAERDDVDHRDGVAADEREVVPSAGEELGETIRVYESGKLQPVKFSQNSDRFAEGYE